MRFQILKDSHFIGYSESSGFASIVKIDLKKLRT